MAAKPRNKVTNAREVLVGILPSRRDLAIARDQRWYRTPSPALASGSATAGRRNGSPSISRACSDLRPSPSTTSRQSAKSRSAPGRSFFPHEPHTRRSAEKYYQIHLGPLHRLPYPILSRRWRRIVFISTTWDKFTRAAEINDLFDGSPLEDRLWAEFKRYHIPAERQDWVKVDGQQYALDFAIYCASGSIDVETDGDSWHATPERAARDNLRDNALQAKGWTVLRFSTPQVQERAAEYCVPKVAETINQLGGLDEGRVIPRNISIAPGNQLGLFDVL